MIYYVYQSPKPGVGLILNEIEHLKFGKVLEEADWVMERTFTPVYIDDNRDEFMAEIYDEERQINREMWNDDPKPITFWGWMKELGLFLAMIVLWAWVIWYVTGH